MNAYPQGVMLPNEQERKQIFHWLKRTSSYTAWNRILGYYRTWAGVTGQSVQKASERGWSNRTGVPEEDLVLILKGLAHCEKGVRRLRLGDKRVFQYNAHGEFVMAYRCLGHWSEFLHRIEIGENGIGKDHTPLWPDFELAVQQLSNAWGECSPYIIEEQDLNASSFTLYNPTMREELTRMTFPKALPDVPDPLERTLIATGKTTPCSGIWEPVDVPKPKGLHLFSVLPLPEGQLPVVGCISYLHGGSKAPQAAQIHSAKYREIDVTCQCQAMARTRGRIG